MDQKKLTHKDLAEAVGVSVTTIKSYRKKFPEFIYVASRGKPIRFEPSTLEVVKRIRKCFGKDLSVEETRKRLRSEFKENIEDRQASEPGSSPIAAVPMEGLEKGIDELKSLVKGMGDKGRDSSLEERLSALEAGFKELISLQSRSHSLNVELLAKLDTISGSLEMKPKDSDRVRPKVVVPRPAPKVNPRQEEPNLETHPVEKNTTPPPDFMALPLVISNDRGEFLGVNLKQGKHLDITGLVEFLITNSGEKPETLNWGRELPFRVLGFGQGARRHELFLKRTNTPKGNQVAVLEKLSLAGEPVSDNFLMAFFKQVKSSLS